MFENDQQRHRIGIRHVEDVALRGDPAAFGDGANQADQRNASFSVAVLAFPRIGGEEQRVGALGPHGAGFAVRLEPCVERNLPGLVGAQTHCDDVVGVRSDDLADEAHAADGITHRRRGLVESRSRR